MRKKSAYAWCLVAALTMAGCSSDQNEAVDVSAKTGTFEIAINFANPDGGTRASTVIPTTSWSNIKQIQFFLYDASGNIKWSEIETPATGTTITATDGRQYVYATVPAGDYTLVALANAQSNTDAVTTYTYASPTSGVAELWTVANVYNRNISNLAIRHKAGAWNSLIASSAVSGLSPYTQPSEVFMGSIPVSVSSTSVYPVTVSLTREVSMMRVRIDRTSYASVAGSVDFDVSNAGILLYNLPNQMGIGAGNLLGGVGAAVGGVSAATTSTNVISISGAYSTTIPGYLEGNYNFWKEAIVFPNNGGRANNPNTTDNAASPYFIVICGVAQAGHVYSGGAIAAAGAPVFWYGQINEVFTPNIIREVNVVLKTGGLPVPPPEIVSYGKLDITVSSPLPWGSIVVTDPIEM